jgi:HPt (histidine-containing phosphotransfer) domain-containing protein
MCPAKANPGSFARSAEVRKIFIHSCEADLRAILCAWQQQDKDDLLKRLHALKGALIVFREGDTAALCEHLEEDLRKHSLPACEGALLELDQALRDLIDSYK